MPFQVSLQASSRVLSPVSLTVGDNLTAPCTDSITLTATITVGYENRHTYLWELASGNPVLFTTPVNQLTATCSFLGINTDRVFYFWVDKGRSYQQLFIVHYWATPTETTPIIGNNSLTTTSTTEYTIKSTDTASTLNSELFDATAAIGSNSITPLTDLVEYNLTAPIISEADTFAVPGGNVVILKSVVYTGGTI